MCAWHVMQCSATGLDQEQIVSKNIIGSVVALAALAGCSTGGDSMLNTITEAVNPTDWNDRVCESPIFMEMIGTFKGQLRFAEGDRSCVWNSTVIVNGQSDTDSCTLTGTIESTLAEQGPAADLPYKCDVGVRDVSYASGLRVGNDLNTLRPESIGFNYPPSLEQRDEAGNELVHAVTQFEYLTVDFDGMRSANGLLVRQ